MKKEFNFEKFFDDLEIYGQTPEDAFVESDEVAGSKMVGDEASPITFQSRIEELGKGVTLELVRISSGRFLMGSPEGEGENNEHPQHSVSIPAFWMGIYPVTQAQWKAVASLPKIKLDLSPDPSKFKGDNRPVEQITWREAIEFCHRLAKKTGGGYRLLREAEWEYACRAGTTTPYHFGETISTDLANYNGNYIYNATPKGKYRKQTSPVGSFNTANSFGLHDMHGNVCEWCIDPWHNNYQGAPTDGSTWRKKVRDPLRVLRGGSWALHDVQVRSSSRSSAYTSFKSSDIGFRVATRFWYN
ncbi:MAG: formylglycine-generating enzyme family protein [Pseudanabaenales cyanobacterium]|nr:formylglycine-generating enzyme family protein [Pseudanabaenales cyanobacterium]